MQALLQRLNLSRVRTATNLLFASVALLIVVQLAEMSSSFGFLRNYGGPNVFDWAILASTVAASSALVWCAVKLRASNLIRAEEIADHIHDGLLFIENDKVTFANVRAHKIIKGDSGREPSLPLEVAAVLRQCQSNNAPVLYDTVIDGSARHYLVSKIELPLKRQIYIFQDVTFLRENEEAKVNFIGALSHEIKTPITSLAMSIAMLERTGFDAELVRIANSDVARLKVLLEDLLSVSRLKIVRSHSALQKQEANLTALVKNTVKATALAAHDKGVRLHATIQPGPHITANIDPTKITWVVSTLLTDAVRQTPQGKDVRIELSMKGREASFTVEYERRLDALGPTGHAIVRDIIEAHAGQFISMHKANCQSLLKFSIHAQLNQQAQTIKGMGINEANLTG